MSDTHAHPIASKESKAAFISRGRAVLQTNCRVGGQFPGAALRLLAASGSELGGGHSELFELDHLTNAHQPVL